MVGGCAARGWGSTPARIRCPRPTWRNCATAAEAQIATDVVHFPGAEKGFDTDQAVLEEAWLRTLNWFDSHLR